MEGAGDFELISANNASQYVGQGRWQNGTLQPLKLRGSCLKSVMQVAKHRDCACFVGARVGAPAGRAVSNCLGPKTVDS